MHRPLLSATVNVFDGHELLPPLVRHLRPLVDHAAVVYQTRSFRGEQADSRLAPLVHALARQGWIDEAVCWTGARAPDGTLKQQEAAKRSVGLELARAAGASHHLSLDVDEFYDPGQFRRAWRFIQASGVDATACCIQDYHAWPTYRCRGLATYLGVELFVPFVCATGAGQRFDPGCPFFCDVDPSRRLPYSRAHLFDPDTLVMHHMTTVRASRASLRSKFANSTSRSAFSLEDPDDLADLVWDFDPARHAAPPVTVVDDAFGLAHALCRARPPVSLPDHPIGTIEEAP